MYQDKWLHGWRFWLIIIPLAIGLILGFWGFILDFPAQGQGPQLTTWENEVVLTRFAPLVRINSTPHLSTDDPTITMISQSLAADGQLHLEFQLTNANPAEVYNIGYLDEVGEFVATNNVWSSSGITSTNVPFGTMRIRCSVNCNWSAGGHLWRAEWDPEGFYGLSRRFISMDKQGDTLSVITNISAPVHLVTNDGQTIWLDWTPIDGGNLYRATVPADFCSFTMSVEGYPFVFTNSPISTDGDGIYRITANCPPPMTYIYIPLLFR